MDSNCFTRLIAFQGNPPEVLIPNINTPNVYSCPFIYGGANLVITIINTEANNYDIKLGDNMFRLIFDPLTKTWNKNNNNKNLGIYFPFGSKYTSQLCGDEILVPDGQITVDVKISNINFNPPYEDKYSILINGCFGIIIRGVIVNFIRTFSTGLPVVPTIGTIRKLLIKKDIDIPYININGQTLIDFSDVGNMIFTIGDEFTYYKEKPLHNTKCITPYPINPDQLKLTIFNKSCPSTVSVLRGRGLTLFEKANSIYNDKVTFPTFYLYLILYGMLKYILSRILYGKFDINFLLRKYNEKFLEDLGSSRFCSFLKIFIDPTSPVFGFNQYFKYNLKK